MPRRHLGVRTRPRLKPAHHIAIGLALVAAGLGITFLARERVAYGAVAVGLIEIARGFRKR